MLARPQWLPAQPVELGQPELHLLGSAAGPAVVGTGPQTESVRPLDDSGERFATYAEAIRRWTGPHCLRTGRSIACSMSSLGDRPRLEFALGHYFDSVSVGEALAHEFAGAAACSGGGPVTLDRLPLRAAIGDPCDLSRRPASVAVTTLTLRRSGPGQASFLLHWRDPAKVTNAGGLYQVMPVGIFQPADDSPLSVGHDLDLWHGLVREFSEELLGAPENLRRARVADPVRAVAVLPAADRRPAHRRPAGLDRRRRGRPADDGD